MSSSAQQKRSIHEGQIDRQTSFQMRDKNRIKTKPTKCRKKNWYTGHDYTRISLRCKTWYEDTFFGTRFTLCRSLSRLVRKLLIFEGRRFHFYRLFRWTRGRNWIDFIKEKTYRVTCAIAWESISISVWRCPLRDK